MQRIDLTVMSDIPKRLGQFPGREGIGGKAGVDEAKGGDHAFVAEVGEIVADLAAGQLAFIDDGFIGEGGHVEADGVLFDRVVDGVAGVIAKKEQLPFEIVRLFDMIGAGDEDLFHFRFYGEGGRADAVGVDGDFAIAEDLQAEFFGRAGEDIAAFFFEADIAGEEEHADAVFAIGGQVDAEPDTFVEKEFMRDLDHDAGAVAGVVFTAAGAAVFHVLQDRQRVGDDLVGFVALDIGNETDATSITFKLRGVETGFNHLKQQY